MVYPAITYMAMKILLKEGVLGRLAQLILL